MKYLCIRYRSGFIWDKVGLGQAVAAAGSIREAFAYMGAAGIVLETPAYTSAAGSILEASA
jgi:hypothetical protein